MWALALQKDLAMVHCQTESRQNQGWEVLILSAAPDPWPALQTFHKEKGVLPHPTSQGLS